MPYYALVSCTMEFFLKKNNFFFTKMSKSVFYFIKLVHIFVNFIFLQVKKNEPVGNTPDHDASPPKKKIRSLNTASPSGPNILDSRFAPHIGGLSVHMDKSVSVRAVLGMTVDQTHVRQCFFIFVVLFCKMN